MLDIGLEATCLPSLSLTSFSFSPHYAGHRPRSISRILRDDQLDFVLVLTMLDIGLEVHPSMMRR